MNIIIVSVFLDAFNIVAVGSMCLGRATQCSYFGTVPPVDKAKSQVLQELPRDSFGAMLSLYGSASRWQSGTLLLVY